MDITLDAQAAEYDVVRSQIRGSVDTKLDVVPAPICLSNHKQRVQAYGCTRYKSILSTDKWGHCTAGDCLRGRFCRWLTSRTTGDYAFISHRIETLKPKSGRMGMIVPHDVVFRVSSEDKVRNQEIDENLLQAVIGLPEKLFFGTGIQAAILIFRKDKNDERVLFIDPGREFNSGKNQNALSVEHIKKIVDTYQARDSVDKYAYLATLEEIQEYDYNLNIPRYVDTFEEEEEIELMAVREKQLVLQKELDQLEIEIAGYLEELRYGA